VRPLYTGKDTSVKAYVRFFVEAEIAIRQMVPEDWESVRSIYLEGLATGDATFETEAPSWEKWDESHLSVLRLVAVSSTLGGVVGWAALSRVSSRAAYGGVAEVSVYVADNFRGKGIGKALLKQLVAQSEQQGLWTLQASVFPENIASLALHKICGFREVGTRQRIGVIHGTWRDTMLLERRSQIVGNE
jgi:L-amino acid N-acyltransferase YncA